MRLLFPGEILSVRGRQRLLELGEEEAETTPRAILLQEEKLGDSLEEQAHGQASR